jgi:hypothetical protein
MESASDVLLRAVKASVEKAITDYVEVNFLTP